MNIQIMNSNNNEWYNFDVDNTTMINIKEQYVRVWISSDICPIIKKEWIPEADHYTLAQCNVLIPEACVFIIIKSF